ncbi:DarT ssDNA thymidine ADP-ribosyltransferase family protein [Mesorhizobium sp. M0138]|uniref:DarT ssDNA thymidine ADP-ribosyltransferase family protein n=1 Tax=unclassified Mesorhizobium TaxID=325217 RepID=UPI00333763E3
MIDEDIRKRNITEVLHFTTNRGVVGTLALRSLLSRRRLPTEAYLEHVLHPNAGVRPESSIYFDKSADWLDYVNLSISEINSRFFTVSERWHQNADVWWAILAFDPVIMAHDGVVFATTNNGYPYCQRASTEGGFEALFAPSVRRKSDWKATRGGRPNFLPTCEQAEVLYPQQVSTDYLRRVYVRSGDDVDSISGWLRELGHKGVQVVLDPDKFLGTPN